MPWGTCDTAWYNRSSGSNSEREDVSEEQGHAAAFHHWHRGRIPDGRSPDWPVEPAHRGHLRAGPSALWRAHQGRNAPADGGTDFGYLTRYANRAASMR